MLSPQAFLAVCHKLSETNLLLPWAPGVRVARGFADLGYEEFQVVGAQSIVSLFTGAKSEVTEDQRRHFFWLPGLDELFELLRTEQLQVSELALLDGREWQLVLTRSEPAYALGLRGRGLAETLASGLLLALEARRAGV